MVFINAQILVWTSFVFGGLYEFVEIRGGSKKKKEETKPPQKKHEIVKLH